MTTGECGQADVEAMEPIKDVAARWTRAVEAGDAAGLGHLMADDIAVIHGDGRVLSGREAVVADFVGSFARCAFPRRSNRRKPRWQATGPSTIVRRCPPPFVRTARRWPGSSVHEH